MYNQRRGLAPPVVSSDADARNANFTLMHNKRRQQLEAQLAEKMEMMKQFSNPRGIGMRGQTVPQRDIDLLQQQIAAIRQQLDAPQDGSQGPSLPHTPSNQAAAVTPGSSASTTHNVTRVQQQQPVAGSYPFPMAPSSCGSTGSRRDEVWQQKYEAWLRRNGGGHPVLSPTRQYGGGGSSCASVMSSAPSQYHAQAASPSTLPAMGMPPQAPPSQSAASSRSNGAPFQQYPQTGAYPIAATGQQGQFAYPQQQQQQQQAMYNAQRQPPAHHQQQVGGYPQHQQQQYQQQQQQQHQQQQQQQQPVMFGRRATPPNSAARSNGPVDAPPQQAPVLGRRGQQVSQRPW